MSIGGRTFRAFRPGRFGRQDEYEEDTQRIKALRVAFYAKRVEAGLPIFDSEAARTAAEGKSLVIS